MKLKHNIRLLVQYEIEAESFNEALLRASKNVLPNNNDGVQFHYVGFDKKRYEFNSNTMELKEVSTFGKWS